VGTNDQMKAALIQIGNSFGSQQYLPYAIGLLQAYAQSRLVDPSMVQFGLPLYSRMSPIKALDQLEGSEILFFSVYLWNHALSREIARLYRESHPDALIVFGGPQVPENRLRLERFMDENPFVDLACYSEGEEPFLKILEQFGCQAWENVPGIAFRQETCLQINPPAALIDDLDLIPSPYLMGIFDPLLNENPQVSWSALVETNRGCPFTCAFCYWGAGNRLNLRRHSLEHVCAEIDWFAQHKIEFVFCCDANFGILPQDMEIVERVAEVKTRTGYPCAFSVQSTKNSTTKIFTLQKRLNDAGLQKGVNLAIKRNNISMKTYSELMVLFKSADIPVFSDLILGLPEESYDSYARGVEQVIRQGQHNRIQFINLTILENTAMVDASYLERYGLHLVDSRIVSHHSSLTEQSNVFENQRLVVGTATMPPTEWVRARVFSWFLALFYFDRLLQIPFILLDRLAGVGIREIAEYCIAQGAKLPSMGSLIAFMHENARNIQAGRPEYVPAPDFLDIWWPLDEYLLIRLMREGALDRLYADVSQLLSPYANRLPEGLLDDALRLNRSLLKEPFITSDIGIELCYEIPELYASFQKGTGIHPVKGIFRYLIDRTSRSWNDWESWMREMVWYGGKKGDYLYPCRVDGMEEVRS
jgi:radical SAM superfamily enzyme YgiQ (UPF0313 family)